VGDKYNGRCDRTGGVVASNNNLYFVPYSSAEVMKCDPTTKVTQRIGNEIAGSYKYSGGTTGSHGYIYTPPVRSKYDPTNQPKERLNHISRTRQPRARTHLIVIFCAGQRYISIRYPLSRQQSFKV